MFLQEQSCLQASLLYQLTDGCIQIRAVASAYSLGEPISLPGNG